MNLYDILSEILLNEISDSAKQKAKEKFKKEDSNLTDAVLDYYVDIFSDKQSSNAFQKKDIMQYTFSELERIVDSNFPRKETSVDIDDLDFEKSEDVIYNQNNLLILLGNLKEKCIRYGTGKSWCISRRDTSNMFFSYRMRYSEPVFYFVFDKDIPPTDKHNAIVIYINSKGEYMVANAKNEGDKEMTWSEIESIQPKLKGLKDLFKHIPLTKEEREDYKKFKNPVNDSTYENFNYTERSKYIGFQHELTEEQIRMTWSVPNQKALISKYVTTGFGTNLPKDIEEKLQPSDKSKMYNYRNDIIKKNKSLTDSQFESCNDDLKRELVIGIIKFSSYINFKERFTDKQFEWCDDDLKKEYIKNISKNIDGIFDSKFELCDYNLKREYIEERIKNRLNISNKQFEWCDDDLKSHFIKEMIKKGYITDSQFEWCDDDLKKEYIKNIKSKGFYLFSIQRKWAEKNKLMESINLNFKSYNENIYEDKDLDKKIIKSFKGKENLSSNIFELKNNEYVMIEDVRKKLLKIADNFMDFLGVEFFIHDVVLTGSLSNYNWSEFSDIDLHILIDFEDAKFNIKLLKEFFNSKKGLWNEIHNVKIKNYDVEIYVQDVKEPHVSSGVYSILNNKWNIEPEKSKTKINEKKIIEKSEEYENIIDKLIKSSNKKDVLKNVDLVVNKIKKFRQCGLESGGEYSYENLTFKLLRRNGYMKKLLDLKTKVSDKKLSIREQ